MKNPSAHKFGVQLISGALKNSFILWDFPYKLSRTNPPCIGMCSGRTWGESLIKLLNSADGWERMEWLEDPGIAASPLFIISYIGTLGYIDFDFFWQNGASQTGNKCKMGI